MSLVTTPASGFSCTYDTGLRQLLAYWYGPATDVELYEQYAELMALAESHDNCRFWQLDVQNRNVSSSALGRWFGNEFAPLAHAVFGRPLFLAYVVGLAHHSSVNNLGVQAMQHSCAAHDVYPFYFDSPAAAHEWLLHQQAHDEEIRIRSRPRPARSPDAQGTAHAASQRSADA